MPEVESASYMPVRSGRIKSRTSFLVFAKMSVGKLFICLMISWQIILACDPGHYQTLEGCLPCEPGTYYFDPLSSESVPEQCYSCMSGTYNSVHGSTACDFCNAGTFANTSGMTICNACPPGTFQYGAGATACIPCPSGTHQGGSGATACVDCEAGSAQLQEGSPDCALCEPGTFSWTRRALVCLACSQGSYGSKAGATACLACPPGTAQSLPRSSHCSACEPGSFQSETGQTQCVPCPAGSFQMQTMGSACELCPLGTFLEQEGHSSPTSCVACVNGTYGAIEGASQCSLCQAGKFRSVEMDELGCLSCPAGTFQTAEGATECRLCSPGSFSSVVGNQQACYLCPPGTFGFDSGASSLESCMQCNAGTYSTGEGQHDASVCIPCDNGLYPRNDAGACVECPHDAFCPAGVTSPVTCGLALVCNGTHLDAIPGYLAYFSGTLAVAIACPPGTTCALKDPQLGKGLLPAYPQQVHFAVSVDGASTRVDSPFKTSDNDTTVFWLLPEECSAGMYLNLQTCVPCPTGTFAAQPGALELDACNPCMAGTFSSSPGHTACHKCTPGSFMSNVGGSVCTACPAGESQGDYGAVNCQACRPGAYSDQAGAVTCAPCPPGTAQGNLGAETCEACNSSQYSSTGSARCLQCGQTAETLDPTDTELCGTREASPSQESAWVHVQAMAPSQPDECLAISNSSLDIVRTFRLHTGVRCQHSLRVAGGLSQVVDDWNEPERPPKASRLQVIPFNDTFYPSACRRGVFGVLVVLRDRSGIPLNRIPDRSKMWMSILDPQSQNLLFQADCNNDTGCFTSRFCPSMSVMVRVRFRTSESDEIIEGACLLYAGQGETCPPTNAWTLGLRLDDPAQAYLPGTKQSVVLEVLNGPSHVKAFRAEIRISRPFHFLAFHGDYPTAVKESNDGHVSLEMDTSHSSVLTRLGRLHLQYKEGDKSQTGPFAGMQVLSAQFMLLRGNWLSTGVQGLGYTCRRDGFLSILIDRPRPTSLIVSPSRRTLVHWKAIHEQGAVWPASILAQAVWNAPHTPVLVTPTCTALTPRTVVVDSCSRIVPTGDRDGEALVLVEYLGVQAVQFFDVAVPVLVDVRLSSRKLLVIASVLGVDIDATLMFFSTYELDCGQDGLVSVIGRSLPCPSHLSTRKPPFLLSGTWTRKGSFRVNPSILSSTTDPVIIAHPSLVFKQSLDLSRARFGDDGKLHLMRTAATPRCVELTSGVHRALIPVFPPAPERLEIQLDREILAGQQDFWGFVPRLTRVAQAFVHFSDGTMVSVLGDSRLIITPDPGLFRLVPPDAIQSRSGNGTGLVTFAVAGIPCLSTQRRVHVFETSVTRSILLCSDCPSRLSRHDDPLSMQWPERFPSVVPASSFVVRHLLVDKTTRDEWTPLHVRGVGVIEDAGVMLAGQSDLVVSTQQTGEDQIIVIPVVKRWAVRASMACNGKPCTELSHLTAVDNFASLSPFNYSTRVSLSWHLELFNATVQEFSWLPDVTVLANDTALGDNRRIILEKRGLLRLQAMFGENWNLEHIQTSIMVHVLDSIQLRAPQALHRIHCTRFFETALVVLTGRFSDGFAFEVEERHATWNWSGSVRMVSGVVHALLFGEGVITAAVGDLTASHTLQVLSASRLFTSYRLPASLPGVWEAPAGTTLILHGVLSPHVEFHDPVALLNRVVRWVSSEPSVVDFPADDSMRLISDFYDPIIVTAVIRGCESSEPITIQHRMLVNLKPDRLGQVDFGNETGPPLHTVALGHSMQIPIFLYAPVPLLRYTGTASLPGLRLGATCGSGELSFSVCTVSNDRMSARFGASFPQSRRVGRIHIASIMGRIELDAISRLEVFVSSAEFEDGIQGNVTYGFAVQLGNATSLIQLKSNSVNSAGITSRALWNAGPEAFEACCSQIVSAPGTQMVDFFPKTFRVALAITKSPTKAKLHHTDPRMQAVFDRSFFEFDSSSGEWVVLSEARGTTSITLYYTQPGTRKQRSFDMKIVIAEARQVFITPATLVLGRVHCSTVFESRPFQVGFTIMHHTGRFDLPVTYATLHLEPFTLAQIERTAVVRGLRPGNGMLKVQGLQLVGSIPVIVQNASKKVTDVLMPGQIIASNVRKELKLSAKLQDGSILSDILFLHPTFVITQDRNAPAVQLIQENQRLFVKGLRNTMPLSPLTLSVRLPVCGREPPLVEYWWVGVKLQPEFSVIHPADIVVDANLRGFHVMLQSREPVSALILMLYTDSPVLKKWRPTASLSATSEMSLDYPRAGALVFAAVFREPVSSAALFFIEPMPVSIQGVLDTSANGMSSQSPIFAGAFGINQSVPNLGKPVVDSGDLHHSVLAQLDPKPLLRLITGKARKVEPAFYSNEHELSAMFRIIDRYFQPDDNISSLQIVFHTGALDVLLSLRGAQVVDGVGITVPAQWVSDGWYAVQLSSSVALPYFLVTRVSYRLVTQVAAREGYVQEETASEAFVIGRPLHACPRYATDRAVFNLQYRIHDPPDNLQAVVACIAHVALRRVRVWAHDGDPSAYMFSITLESFIRLREAHRDIMAHFSTANRSRRLLAETQLEQVGVTYVNDTADQTVPCPAGMFFSLNGTYERLPVHSKAGPDCYGFDCTDGYVLVGTSECLPAGVSRNIIWICTIVILSGVSLLGCVFCALYISRMRRESASTATEPQVAPSVSNVSDSVTMSDPLDDDPYFKNVLTGMYLDAYSASMLDDDFSCVPIDEPENTSRSRQDGHV